MADLRKWRATVTATGTLEVAEHLLWREFLEKFRGSLVVLTIKKWHPQRSLAQNRRHFGLLMDLAGQVLSMGRPIPFTEHQVHDLLCRVFIGEEETELGPIRKSSSDLDTKEFGEWMDKVAHWLWHDHKIVIPERGEER